MSVAFPQAVDTSPSHRGPLEGFSHFGGSGARGDGPYAYLWLIVEGGIIARASYQTPGCPSSSMLGEILCRLLVGRPLAVMATLTAEDLIRIAGSVPEGRGFYVQMFIDALRQAAGSHEGFEERES